MPKNLGLYNDDLSTPRKKDVDACYGPNNAPPYPVTSVNGQTGGVNLIASDVGAAPSTYLGNISRNKIYKIGYFFKGSGASSSGAVAIRIRNFSDYRNENYMLAFLGAYGFSVEYHGQITTTYTSKISVYSDPSVTGSDKKYTVFVTTQNYVDWAGVYIDNEHSFTRDFADVTDTFSALVDGLDKVWESEYEYLNPPMQLGVEYRTTERYRGKPVYMMMLPSVTLGSAGSTAYIEGLANIKDIIDYRIQFQYASSGQTFAVNNWSKVKVATHYDSGYAYASIACIEDCSNNKATGTFKYTKTTD